jgi:hypothetical protein
MARTEDADCFPGRQGYAAPSRDINDLTPATYPNQSVFRSRCVGKAESYRPRSASSTRPCAQTLIPSGLSWVRTYGFQQNFFATPVQIKPRTLLQTRSASRVPADKATRRSDSADAGCWRRLDVRWAGTTVRYGCLAEV